MRVVYCFAAMLSFFTAYSQYEFAPIGAKWIQNVEVNTDNGENPLENFYVLESLKDTIIQNKTFRLVNEYAFHQKDHKVYLWYADSLNLIYDFGLTVGDTITYNILECFGITDIDFVVTDKSIVNINGRELIKLVHSPLIYENDYEIIEGIGDINSAFESFSYNCFSIPGAIAPWLRCYQDENIYYQSERFISYNQESCEYRPTSNTRQQTDISFEIYPNPATQYTTILAENISSTLEQFEIMDYKGKIVSKGTITNGIIDISYLPSGIYLLKIGNSKVYSLKKVMKI